MLHMNHIDKNQKPVNLTIHTQFCCNLLVEASIQYLFMESLVQINLDFGRFRNGAPKERRQCGNHLFKIIFCHECHTCNLYRICFDLDCFEHVWFRKNRKRFGLGIIQFCQESKALNQYDWNIFYTELIGISSIRYFKKIVKKDIENYKKNSKNI